MLTRRNESLTNALRLESRLCCDERRSCPVLDFAPHPAPNDATCEPAQAVGSAPVDRDQPESWPSSLVGQQDAKFERRPEVVARVQHLRRDHRRLRTLLNHQMADADGRPQSELCFLP